MGRQQRRLQQQLRPQELDVYHLLLQFLAGVQGSGDLSLAAFKQAWQQLHFSYIFEAPPFGMLKERYVQLLYSIVLDVLLHGIPPSAAEQLATAPAALQLPPLALPAPKHAEPGAGQQQQQQQQQQAQQPTADMPWPGGSLQHAQSQQAQHARHVPGHRHPRASLPDAESHYDLLARFDAGVELQGAQQGLELGAATAGGPAAASALGVQSMQAPLQPPPPPQQQQQQGATEAQSLMTQLGVHVPGLWEDHHGLLVGPDTQGPQHSLLPVGQELLKTGPGALSAVDALAELGPNSLLPEEELEAIKAAVLALGLPGNQGATAAETSLQAAGGQAGPRPGTGGGPAAGPGPPPQTAAAVELAGVGAVRAQGGVAEVVPSMQPLLLPGHTVGVGTGVLLLAQAVPEAAGAAGSEAAGGAAVCQATGAQHARAKGDEDHEAWLDHFVSHDEELPLALPLGQQEGPSQQQQHELPAGVDALALIVSVPAAKPPPAVTAAAAPGQEGTRAPPNHSQLVPAGAAGTAVAVEGPTTAITQDFLEAVQRQYRVELAGAALLALYCLYCSQPGSPIVKAYLSAEHQRALLEVLPKLQKQGFVDAVAAVRKLHSLGALAVGAPLQMEHLLANTPGGGLKREELALVRELKFHFASTLPGLGTGGLQASCNDYEAHLAEMWSALYGPGASIPQSIADLAVGKLLHDYSQAKQYEVQAVLRDGRNWQAVQETAAAAEAERSARRGNRSKARSRPKPPVPTAAVAARIATGARTTERGRGTSVAVAGGGDGGEGDEGGDGEGEAEEEAEEQAPTARGPGDEYCDGVGFIKLPRGAQRVLQRERARKAEVRRRYAGWQQRMGAAATGVRPAATSARAALRPLEGLEQEEEEEEEIDELDHDMPALEGLEWGLASDMPTRAAGTGERSSTAPRRPAPRGPMPQQRPDPSQATEATVEGGGASGPRDKADAAKASVGKAAPAKPVRSSGGKGKGATDSARAEEEALLPAEKLGGRQWKDAGEDGGAPATKKPRAQPKKDAAAAGGLGPSPKKPRARPVKAAAAAAAPSPAPSATAAAASVPADSVGWQTGLHPWESIRGEGGEQEAVARLEWEAAYLAQVAAQALAEDEDYDAELPSVAPLLVRAVPLQQQQPQQQLQKTVGQGRPGLGPTGAHGGDSASGSGKPAPPRQPHMQPPQPRKREAASEGAPLGRAGASPPQAAQPGTKRSKPLAGSRQRGQQREQQYAPPRVEAGAAVLLSLPSAQLSKTLAQGQGHAAPNGQCSEEGAQQALPQQARAIEPGVGSSEGAAAAAAQLGSPAAAAGTPEGDAWATAFAGLEAALGDVDAALAEDEAV